MQHEVSTVLLLVEQPDRITRAREWISGLPDKIMPAEERQHVLTLFSHLEQAVKDRPRRITRTVHTRPHPAGSQPVSPERDQVIQDTVMAAMQAFKLHKTRSRGSRKEPRKESACSLIAKALNKLGVSITASNVERICKDIPSPR